MRNICIAYKIYYTFKQTKLADEKNSKNIIKN